MTTSFGDEIESFLFPILSRSLHLRREQLTKYKALTIKRLDQCKYIEKFLFTQHVCMKKIEFMIIKVLVLKKLSTKIPGLEICGRDRSNLSIKV